VNTYSFGYPWYFTHGHLVLAACFLLTTILVRLKWVRFVAAALTLWALSAFGICQLVLRWNRPVDLPTQNFLKGGVGRVIDLGAGSGRATIAVGLARPQVKLVALDDFSAQYIRDNGPATTIANARAAGIADRVEVLTADMRKIPAPDASFDGVVSTYAIDHLGRDGIEQTLGEVKRILRPGGEFLMLVIRGDAWLGWCFGPLMMHGLRGPEFWQGELRGHGLDIVEQGTAPGTLWYMCRSGQPVAAGMMEVDRPKEVSRR